MYCKAGYRVHVDLNHSPHMVCMAANANALSQYPLHVRLHRRVFRQTLPLHRRVFRQTLPLHVSVLPGEYARGPGQGRGSRGAATPCTGPLSLMLFLFIIIITATLSLVFPVFLPHFGLYGAALLHRCVLPYRYRTILEMTLKLMKSCELMGAGTGQAAQHPRARDNEYL